MKWSSVDNSLMHNFHCALGNNFTPYLRDSYSTDCVHLAFRYQTLFSYHYTPGTHHQHLGCHLIVKPPSLFSQPTRSPDKRDKAHLALGSEARSPDVSHTNLSSSRCYPRSAHRAPVLPCGANFLSSSIWILFLFASVPFFIPLQLQ